MTSTPRAAATAATRSPWSPRVFEQAQALTTLGDRPLVVLTASENLEHQGWAAAQDSSRRSPPTSLHRDVDVDPRRPASTTRTAPAESVRAITAVVPAVSTGSALATP